MPKQATRRGDVLDTGGANLPAGYIGCSVETTTAQSIAGGASAKITFATPTVDDSDTMWDVTNSRLVINTEGSGWWELTAVCVWDVRNDDTLRQTNPRLNGADIGRQDGAAGINTADGGFGTAYATYGIIGPLIVGDYVELFARHQSGGGNLNVIRARLTLRMLK